VLNALCLNATDLHPRTKNANAKKKTRPLEHIIARVAADMQRHIIINQT
jgi:hypothetical protein